MVQIVLLTGGHFENQDGRHNMVIIPSVYDSIFLIYFYLIVFQITCFYHKIWSLYSKFDALKKILKKYNIAMATAIKATPTTS
jgi:hypothetical protein